MLYELVQDNDGVGVTVACEALGVSRSGFNAWRGHAPALQDGVLLKKIQAVALEYPFYGYRRITVELNGINKQHFVANRKKVLAVMREHGLTVRKRSYKIRTTDSNHGLPVYPNLAKGFEVTSINQLWVADITYIHLPRGFVYLAVVIDRFSRRVIGWQLSRDIDAQLCLDALHKAFEQRKESSLAGLIHHSDQGVQYASHDYVEALQERGVLVSMSRKGNPYDNAFAESFMKTLKQEEVYMSEYASFQDALDNIEKFIEVVYNKKRLHSSIGYRPPAEFERQHLKEAFA